MIKLCTGCNLNKSLNAFNKQRGGKYGVTSRCKSCTSVYDKNRVDFIKSSEKRNVGKYKRCTDCNQSKTINEFYVNKSRWDGLTGVCKTCSNEKDKKAREVLRAKGICIVCRKYPVRTKTLCTGCLDRMYWSEIYRRYKLSKEQYMLMLQLQNNRCAICKRSSNDRRLSVDHNHNCCSGAKSCGFCVRGLLCVRCNTLIFYVEELLHNKTILKLNEQSAVGKYLLKT